jgi:hypothetical protein
MTLAVPKSFLSRWIVQFWFGLVLSANMGFQPGFVAPIDSNRIFHEYLATKKTIEYDRIFGDPYPSNIKSVEYRWRL